jgi:hypothetical protein
MTHAEKPIAHRTRPRGGHEGRRALGEQHAYRADGRPIVQWSRSRPAGPPPRAGDRIRAGRPSSPPPRRAGSGRATTRVRACRRHGAGACARTPRACASVASRASRIPTSDRMAGSRARPAPGSTSALRRSYVPTRSATTSARLSPAVADRAETSVSAERRPAIALCEHVGVAIGALAFDIGGGLEIGQRTAPLWRPGEIGAELSFIIGCYWSRTGVTAGRPPLSGW